VLSCTIRVLAGFGRNPSSASSTVNRANAASACPFDREARVEALEASQRNREDQLTSAFT
jgi:hypothetical protein